MTLSTQRAYEQLRDLVSDIRGISDPGIELVGNGGILQARLTGWSPLLCRAHLTVNVLQKRDGSFDEHEIEPMLSRQRLRAEEAWTIHGFHQPLGVGEDDDQDRWLALLDVDRDVAAHVQAMGPNAMRNSIAARVRDIHSRAILNSGTPTIRNGDAHLVEIPWDGGDRPAHRLCGFDIYLGENTTFNGYQLHSRLRENRFPESVLTNAVGRPLREIVELQDRHLDTVGERIVKKAYNMGPDTNPMGVQFETEIIPVRLDDL